MYFYSEQQKAGNRPDKKPEIWLKLLKSYHLHQLTPWWWWCYRVVDRVLWWFVCITWLPTLFFLLQTKIAINLAALFSAYR